MIKSIQNISSLESIKLEPYRTLRRPMDHLYQGIFVAESEKVVLRLLESSIEPISILLSAEWLDLHRMLIENNPHRIEIFVGEKKLLESIVGHRLHQSIMAVAKVPRQISIEEMLQKKKATSRYVLVDGITNSENMGVIVRNCVCFDVDALIVLPSSCDPYLRRSVRNSMGNIFQLPIVYANDSLADIQKMKSTGIILYAAHPQMQSREIGGTPFSSNSCIVLGAEGHGISAEILLQCDEFVTIPMKDGVDSLNVASASAVILYEAMKRKN